MKKALFISVFFVLLVLLCGCKSEKQQIEIIIPAGSEKSFVFSDEVFAATKDKIIVTAGAGFDNTSVTLKTEKVSEENAYEPIYLSHEEPVMIKVEKDGWFVKTLLSAHDSVTGKVSQPISMGGSTFSRAFNKGCAFGPEVDGHDSKIHDANENVSKEHLIKCYQIYKLALKKLLTE